METEWNVSEHPSWPCCPAASCRRRPPMRSWCDRNLMTLGLIAFWWLGTRQHRLTISRLPDLLTIDAEKLKLARKILRRFRERPLRPANKACRDDVRQELNRTVLIGVLGLEETILDSLGILREQRCPKPSVRGGTSRRPEGA